MKQRLPLSEAEIAFLERLESRTLRLDRREMIQHAGERMREAFVLQSGWAASYTQFGDGGRQIRRLHLPGDLMGMPSMALRHHAEDIEALTPVVVSPFNRDQFATLFERHPRLAAIMFIFAQEERVTSGDRLGCVGRLDSKERIGFLLVDIVTRLRRIDGSITNTFELHLSREQMAEMTGMTPVHASRMWSRLVSDGLIASEGHVVTILDEPRLLRISAYVDRFRDLDFNWIPRGDAAQAPIPRPLQAAW